MFTEIHSNGKSPYRNLKQENVANMLSELGRRLQQLAAPQVVDEEDGSIKQIANTWTNNDVIYNNMKSYCKYAYNNFYTYTFNIRPGVGRGQHGAGEQVRLRRVHAEVLGWHDLSNATRLKYSLVCFLRHCLSNTAN